MTNEGYGAINNDNQEEFKDDSDASLGEVIRKGDF